MLNSRICTIFLLFLALQGLAVLAEDEVKRIDSEIDESSCVCGLNKELLERIEHLALLGSSTSSTTCSGGSNTSQNETPGKVENSANPRHDSGEPNPPASTPTVDNDAAGSDEPKEAEHKDSDGGSNESSQKEEHPKESVDTNVASSVTYETKPTTSETPEFKDPQFMIGYISKLTAEIHKLETQMSSMIQQQTAQVQPPSPPLAVVDSVTTPPTQTVVVSPPSSSIVVKEENHDKSSGGSKHSTSTTSTTTTTITETIHQQQQPIDSNFLAALKPANNEALMKLNQSQKVEPQVMENALQSIIPNLVSSIFTSINKLELQTIQQQNGSSSSSSSSSNSNTENPVDTGKLTSIDGSSIDVAKSDTSDQVLASGEKLFLLWIEHQLKGFHLTASMANYITRNALNLFRRMVRQYIKRLEKVGGSLNENARRATQLALSSSQTVTAFLLRNYINFAGGLLQIVGDSMSKVGKHIDTTGGNIAHMSLNPFDIVSNVIESLPNPADYSKYFRAFGKQLMGETLSSTLANKPSESQNLMDGDKHEVSTTATVDGDSKVTNQRPATLLSKTMGALSKTLTSWMG